MAILIPYGGWSTPSPAWSIDPRTGREIGIGRDRRDAIEQAIEANHKISGEVTKRRLVDRLTTGKEDSVSAWCDRYLEILDARHDAGKIAAATRKDVGRRVGKFREAWGEKRIDTVTTRDVADFLEPWEKAGKGRMAQAMRSLLFDFFRAAQAKGWVKDNPVLPTKAPDVEVKRERLKLDDFLAIHAVAVRDYVPWLARAMELALVTGLRREDVSRIGPRDAHDGKLWVTPKKTEKKHIRISIPLALRLHAMGWSVGEVIARCRDNVLSRTFVHHASFAGRAKPGDKVRPHTITMWFAEARDKTGLTWDGAPPSFHEIRSLCSRLYEAEGIDVKKLLGHKTDSMSALYRDSRGAEWIDVPLPDRQSKS